jgi:hypothetical protein
MSESNSITGRWRITEMDNWDQEAVDLVQPGFIEFDDNGLGSLGFIVVTGELDCRDADRDGKPGVEFSWQGCDEGDDVSGRGWARSIPVARSRVTSTSTLVMIPRSEPNDSTESSSERSHRSRDGGSAPARPLHLRTCASFSLVNELQSAAARIAEADPERAVGLYETFIAACHEKGEEGDGQSI